MWRKFQTCPHLQKFQRCPWHALAARVVANMSPWGKLRTIVRLNLFIHFRAHFYIMLRKSMKWYGVTHCTLINLVSTFSKIGDSCII